MERRRLDQDANLPRAKRRHGKSLNTDLRLSGGHGTHGDVVKEAEGGGAAAGAGDDAPRLLPHRAALPVTAAVRARRHHLTLPVLQVHRRLEPVSGGVREGWGVRRVGGGGQGIQV